MSNKIVIKINDRAWPNIRPFLTQEEYEQEKDVFTTMKINELKKFCNSRECDIIEIMCKIKLPRR
jgi:hypothetical protein